MYNENFKGSFLKQFCTEAFSVLDLESLQKPRRQKIDQTINQIVAPLLIDRAISLRENK